MLSQQEISDRLELQGLLTAYSHALDGRDWDAFDGIFTADAVVDYTVMGGPRFEGDIPAVKTYLEETMKLMVTYQHLVGTSRFEIDGDEAKVRTYCFNPMVLDTGAGRDPLVFFVGLWYRDRCVRTEAGWRISERVEELSYFHNFPGGRPPGAAEFGTWP